MSARSATDCGRMRHDRNMIPSAINPTSSSGCREFLRVIRLSVASTAAEPPSPIVHSASVSGNLEDSFPPTVTQGRNALTARAIPATSGMM